jgi:hypothetical protein
MLAFSGGSASKLRPVKTTSKLSLRDSPHTKFLVPEEGDIRSPRVCDLPRCGAARKRNWADNVCMIDQRNKGSVMTEDGTSIHVRIDDEGYTHITVIQWDENGREIVYREDENFQCSNPQF